MCMHFGVCVGGGGGGGGGGGVRTHSRSLLTIPRWSTTLLIRTLSFLKFQIFGGAGYNQEYPVEKLMRDAKIFMVCTTY